MKNKRLSVLKLVLVILVLVALVLGYLVISSLLSKKTEQTVKTPATVTSTEDTWNKAVEVESEQVSTDTESKALLSEITDATDTPIVDTTDEKAKFDSNGEDLMSTEDFDNYLRSLQQMSMYGATYVSYTCYDNGLTTYTYNLNNTDMIFNVEYTEDTGYTFLDCVNKYGTDCPTIVFTQGLPSNTEAIYVACINSGFADSYYTSYVEGDTEITLLDPTDMTTIIKTIKL